MLYSDYKLRFISTHAKHLSFHANSFEFCKSLFSSNLIPAVSSASSFYVEQHIPSLKDITEYTYKSVGRWAGLRGGRQLHDLQCNTFDFIMWRLSILSLLVIKVKIRNTNSSFSVVGCPSGSFPFGPVAYLYLFDEGGCRKDRKEARNYSSGEDMPAFVIGLRRSSETQNLNIFFQAVVGCFLLGI